jgi:DNA primase
VAGRIRDEDVALVREQTPIADIIGEHVQLRNAGGGNMKGICPFHDEKSPSLSVSPARGLFHCLSAETQVLTSEGTRAIAELAGTTATILTEGGRWVQAPFYAFGEQQLWAITVRRDGRRKTLFATDEHRWFLSSSGPGGTRGAEVLTKNLRAGHTLASVSASPGSRQDTIAPSPFGIARGITFGDGRRVEDGSHADLVTGEVGKDIDLLKWFPLSDTYEREGRITVTGLPAYFVDQVPDTDESPSYLCGWLAGYFATRGHLAADGDAILSCADAAVVEYVRAVCSRIGIDAAALTTPISLGLDTGTSHTHQIRLRPADLTPEFFLLADHRRRFESHPPSQPHRHWVVESVEPTDRFETVYCAVVEATHTFVLEDDILTGNCFGCSAGGDVIKFIMDIEHLDFTEAVERLASRSNITLRYVEGTGAPRRPEHGQRKRLIEAHAAAAAFYAAQLLTNEAQVARDFLQERGFDSEAAQTFGCGFAPSGWDALTKHLQGLGFTHAELILGGLARESGRGSLIDRFHRRLLWPIRDVSGDVVGFGARRLFDDDKVEAKYLNTPETPIYKKSTLLYGVDLAKKEIARQHRAVIVEGYTDVMACHLAGVTTAIASCGTAFGTEHIGVIRRLLMDSDTFTGEVIFTFDGDNAGMKAAERAFGDDQKFMAQTFVAIEATGMDPCELRMKSGDTAVLDLVARRIPLVEFVLRNTVKRFDLDTAEGRVAAIDTAIPHVARIKDRALRDEYARRLAGLVGFGLEEQVLARVRGLARADDRGSSSASAKPGGLPAPATTASTASGAAPEKVPEVVVSVEREVLKVALQLPAVAGPQFDALTEEAFLLPAHREVRAAIGRAGGSTAAVTGPGWTAAVAEHIDESLRSGVHALSVEPLHAGADGQERYADQVLARMHEMVAGRQVATVKGRLQRINPQEQPEEHARLFGELIALESYRRGLRDRAIGSE